jgi:hypothetical protein
LANGTSNASIPTIYLKHTSTATAAAHAFPCSGVGRQNQSIPMESKKPTADPLGQKGLVVKVLNRKMLFEKMKKMELDFG